MSQSEYEWTREELLGHINPASNADFVVVSSNYTRKTDIYLREETYQAFEAMWKAAKDDGIGLESSARREHGEHKKVFGIGNGIPLASWGLRPWSELGKY
jgi:hypothetical protein